MGLVLVSLASLSVTILRRQRMRRRLAARVADRLAALVAAPGSVGRAVPVAVPAGRSAPGAVALTGGSSTLAGPEPGGPSGPIR